MRPNVTIKHEEFHKAFHTIAKHPTYGMSNNTHNYLLMQILEDPNAYDFSNSLENKIKSKVKEGDVVFTIDNFSDAISIGYAGELLQAENITIVCHVKADAPLGKLTILFNQVIRHPQARLFANQETKSIKPFMTHMKGKIFKTERELWPHI